MYVIKVNLLVKLPYEFEGGRAFDFRDGEDLNDRIRCGSVCFILNVC